MEKSVTNNEEVFQHLRAGADALLQLAQNALTFSKEPGDIKRACDDLRDLLRGWTTLDKHVDSTVRGLLQLVQKNCAHQGAQHGYNERDGNWMSPCPTCGESR